MDLKAVHLVPSDGGRFEVSLDGKPVFSKLGLHRHPEAGEILKLIGQGLGAS